MIDCCKCREALKDYGIRGSTSANKVETTIHLADDIHASHLPAPRDEGTLLPFAVSWQTFLRALTSWLETL